MYNLLIDKLLKLVTSYLIKIPQILPFQKNHLQETNKMQCSIDYNAAPFALDISHEFMD